MTPLELFELAHASGLRFSLAGEDEVYVDGPPAALRKLRQEILANADDLVALVEEFATETAPVQAAMNVLLAANAQRSPRAGGTMRTRSRSRPSA
jgi:hypothetical protein